MERTDTYLALITTALERLTKNKDHLLDGKPGWFWNQEVGVKSEYNQDVLHLQKFIGANIFSISDCYSEQSIKRLLQQAEILLSYINLRIPFIKSCSTEQLVTIFLTASTTTNAGIGNERVMRAIEDELFERQEQSKTPA